MRSVCRVLLGLIIANLVAGLVQASFIITPADLAGLRGEVRIERLQSLGILALLAASQGAVFAGPAALIAVGIAEWRRIRSVVFYILLGLFLAGVGFLAQQFGEGTPTIVINIYALAAYAATGFAASMVYWLITGRSAGGKQAGKSRTSAA